MAKIKLEFEKLQLLRSKERWNLYFVIVTDHPTDPEKMVVTTFPDPYFRLKPNQNNVVNFVPESGEGTDGLFVFEREMPADRRIRVRVYLRHSRDITRDLGKILNNLKAELGDEAFNLTSNILGGSAPWLEISKNSFPVVGRALMNIKDRDFGMVCMDEDFNSEFESQTELDRDNKFTSGDAKIIWSWSVKE
jgi:hypothetical protein